jgi:hypothetical protein
MSQLKRSLKQQQRLLRSLKTTTSKSKSLRQVSHRKKWWQLIKRWKKPLKRRRILLPNRNKLGGGQLNRNSRHGVKLLRRKNPHGGNPLKKSLLNGDGESLMKYLIKRRK